MSWVRTALEALSSGQRVEVRPRGHSMRGRIEDGQAVTLSPRGGRPIRPGDVVFVRWKGGALLHLALEVEPDRVLIGNNRGGVNGWARLADVVGVLVSAELVDIGVNLAHRSFEADRAQVIERGLSAGVRQLVITGTDVAGSRRAAWLAKDAPGRLFATAGVHPHHAKDFDAGTIDALKQLAGQPEVVALGECGLDFNRNFSPPDAQRACFEAQLTLAAELDKPLFLHERDAFEAMRETLAKFKPRRAVVHCFTGNGPALDAYLELGMHIGITGWICDERRGVHLRELVRRIPRGKLMLETDAPFLAPSRGQRRNEPAFLPQVLEAVAKARDESVEECARHTTEAARAFFGLPTTA
jgi:TatD DNase family protein